jgi:RNA recognition motif-containing protein
MAVRLFVGNLPYNVTEAELREHFSAVGPVAGVWIATDRETGRPRGFAFVEFEDRAAAEEAVRRFNSKPFGGRPLAVNEARPQERGSAPPARRPMPSGPPPPRPSYGGGGGGGGGGGQLLPPDAPPEDAFNRGARDRSRNFGPDAPSRKPPTKKKDRDRNAGFDRAPAPKRPIRVTSGGRFLSSDDFDDFDDEENLDDLETEFEGELEGEGAVGDEAEGAEGEAAEGDEAEKDDGEEPEAEKDDGKA